MSLARILDEKEEKLLADERRILGELRLRLDRLELADEDASRFDASIEQLDELFLLVVAGEFNAGKSAFINALVGEPLLAEGVTPTTQKILLLKFGEETRRETESEALEWMSAPLEVLRKVNLVDTPGTNAIHREHEAITRDFVPRSDLVLFVTSADRPFTESERGFLSSIRDWGKKVVIVVNKIDLLDKEEDRDEIMKFVAENAQKLLAITPEIFALSSKQAARAKKDKDESLLLQSHFGELESYIAKTLDDRQRVRLKLLNPIGVGRALSKKYRELVESQLHLLKDDVLMIEQLDGQLELYQSDQHRDFGYRLSDIDNALLDFESRGAAYFEETMRLPRVFDLVNKAKVKSDFEKKVVADLPRQVETRVVGVIDWMVDSELRQWKVVMQRLDERRSAHPEGMMGELATNFEQDRKRLLDTVAVAARRAVDSYDQDHESSRLAESVQASVATAAALEVGAIGLGALVSLIATTTAVDVTGIVAAGAVSVLGLLVLPARKRKAKKELTRKVAEVRERLTGSLEDQFGKEMTSSVTRIKNAIAPYTRFVRAERDRLSRTREELSDSSTALARLQTRIESL